MKKLRKLIIVGAHGHGREILWTASDVPPESRDWEISAFLDDDVTCARRVLREKAVNVPVLGSIDDHTPASDEVFVCAVQTPTTKLRLCDMLRKRGATFVNVVHPTALLHPSAAVGTGVVLRHYSGVGPNAIVGDFVTINSSAGTAHDSVTGDGCTIGAHGDLMGGARLGRGVYLGTHAVVLPNASVGDFAVIGVGSVVLRRVAAGATVFGVPAKPLSFVRSNPLGTPA